MNGHRTKDTFFRRRPTGDSSVCEDQANPCVLSYTCDGGDRLRVARDDRRGAGVVTTTYELDPAGNITRQIVEKGGSATTTDFTYGVDAVCRTPWSTKLGQVQTTIGCS